MKRLRLIPMVAAGAALSLAFPPASFWPLAWIGLVPLLLALRNTAPRRAALLGLAYGVGFFGCQLYWIAIFGYVPWALLTLMQSIPIAAFATLAAIIYRMRRPWLELFGIPSLWTALEWIRSLGTYGFTWGDLAYSQAPNLPAVQVAAVTGPWGLSFAIALVGSTFAMERPRRVHALVAAAAMLIALHVGGAVSVHRQPATEGRMTVALIQGAIDQDIELTRARTDETVKTYSELTVQAANREPDLVVWPETVVPSNVVDSRLTRQWISSLARLLNAHLLVGAPYDLPAQGSTPASQMNGAYMFGPDGRLLGSYYKVHLVPFGEFVPARKWLPFLERYKIRDVDVRPGKSHNLLQTGFGSVGVMICFESIFPSIARMETRNGARLLAVITNDGWFKRTAAAAQHLDFSVFRAVENRRYVVRNAATGISSVIEPTGRLQNHLGIWKRGVLHGQFETRTGLTFYSRYGDWFAHLSAAVAVVALLISFIRKPNEGRLPGKSKR